MEQKQCKILHYLPIFYLKCMKAWTQQKHFDEFDEKSIFPLLYTHGLSTFIQLYICTHIVLNFAQ